MPKKTAEEWQAECVAARKANLDILARLPQAGEDDQAMAQVVADTLLAAVAAADVSQVALIAGIGELLANVICATGRGRGCSPGRVVEHAKGYGEILVGEVRQKLFAHEQN